MMQLQEPDVKDFFRLYWVLLFYANKQKGIDPKVHDLDTLKAAGAKKLLEITNALFSDKGIIESYCQKNPDELSCEDLRTVGRWKDFIKGRFIICKYTKKNTIFLHESDDNYSKVYGVMALNTPFQMLVGDRPPILVETVLLPFRGKIITNGLLAPYNIFFGPGYKASIKAACEHAMTEHGLITTLDGTISAKPSDEDRLYRYLKTETNRRTFRKEIWDLISKDKGLENIYHQKMGHVSARVIRKRLKTSGIEDGWFAILDGLVIAGGKDHDPVEEMARGLVPRKRWGHIHYFRFDG
jgi:hypothetical protein